MSLFKQKLSIYELIYALVIKIVETPELFPTDESLLEQGDFTKSELKRIRAETIKLAIIYVHLYSLELSHRGKIKVSEDLCRLAYGQALLAVCNDKSINFESSSIDRGDLINTLDGYTSYIAQHFNKKKYDDYYLAYLHFEQVIFLKRDTHSTPVAAVTLAKYIRTHVSKMLLDDLLKTYKIV